MNENQEQIEKIVAIVNAVAKGEIEAVLTTVTPQGEPHATWMGTVSSRNHYEILTITSPDSEKVRNIRANPKVEWMFTDETKETVVYMKGEAEEVTDTEKVKEAWDMLADKRRAFFLEYFNTGVGFTVLCTRVRKVIYCQPRKNEKREIRVDEMG